MSVCAVEIDRETHKRLDTAMSSALTAEVTAMLDNAVSTSGSHLVYEGTHKTTRSTATAPPLPITAAAAAGAASPALVWDAESGLG